MENQTKLIRSCCEGVSFITDIKEALPNDDLLKNISNVTKAMSDPTRLKILYALMDYEICVGEMVNVLNLPQSHVSHQLKALRKYGIVDFNKEKKMSFYYIKDEYVREILTLLLKEKEV
ncbi:hypothetical protein LPB137_05020 [Poseidonibacter parvus]|uniref:HTH arsR-type domain-containing protein n=1 Tax=Poseidonibacter parvus TaxID=1850254 RepID=A0A1P8KL35_9BACT|nr:metalloregulator ArsR/SmtB family transcription factor [Poseidonibacter parvus]APW65250.1 hypothetical protein LPB137_05020 [Poseidonibacter parvus]